MLATVLIDVCYRLYAEVVPNKEKSKLPEKAIAWDKQTTSPGHAYQEIFNRRLKRGQCYSIPSLGWKEFTPSYFGAFRPSTRVLSEMEPVIIPSMLRQVFPRGYNSQVSFVYDNDIKIQNGILEYPKRGIQLC